MRCACHENRAHTNWPDHLRHSPRRSKEDNTICRLSDKVFAFSGRGRRPGEWVGRNCLCTARQKKGQDDKNPQPLGPFGLPPDPSVEFPARVEPEQRQTLLSYPVFSTSNSPTSKLNSMLSSSPSFSILARSSKRMSMPRIPAISSVASLIGAETVMQSAPV